VCVLLFVAHTSIQHARVTWFALLHVTSFSPTTKCSVSTGTFEVLMPPPNVLPSIRSQDNHLHLCSFCGSKGHHTLSWTCCTKPPEDFLTVMCPLYLSYTNFLPSVILHFPSHSLPPSTAQLLNISHTLTIQTLSTLFSLSMASLLLTLSFLRTLDMASPSDTFPH
jgi:hypothetical protein